MRFMMMIKATASSEAGQPPDPKLMEAVGKYTEEMIRAGVVLATGGLAPSFAGTRINLSGGKLAIIDGPFSETKELIGGYAIIQATSKEEAVEFGARFMKLHLEAMGPSYEGSCEVRQVFGPEDMARP